MARWPQLAIGLAALGCACGGTVSGGSGQGRVSLSGQTTALGSAAGTSFTATYQIRLSYLDPVTQAWVPSYSSGPVGGSAGGSLAQIGGCIDSIHDPSVQDGLATVTLLSLTSNDPAVTVVGWSGPQTQAFACIAERDVSLHLSFQVFTSQPAFGFDDLTVSLSADGHDTSNKLECKDGFPTAGASSLISGFAQSMVGQQLIVDNFSITNSRTASAQIFAGYSDPGAKPPFGYRNLAVPILAGLPASHFERLAYVMPTPAVSLRDSVAALSAMDLDANCAGAACCRNAVRTYVHLSSATVAPGGATCSVTNDPAGASLWSRSGAGYVRVDLVAALPGLTRVIASCESADCSSATLLYLAGSTMLQASCALSATGATCTSATLLAPSCLDGP